MSSVALQIGPFDCLPGMLLTRQATLQEWEAGAKCIFDMQRYISWWVGDMVNFGEIQFGESLYQAMPTDVSDDLVRRLVWMARQYPIATRNCSLSWSHHRNVARLPDANLRQAVLKRAELEGWNSAETAQHVARIVDA